MVVNGASRRSVSFWSRHLTDCQNQRAELTEIRGLAATDLKGALREMQDDARYTRCTNFFYQCNFNPAPNELLTEAQWQKAFAIFERHRGIPDGQARIVIEHEKHGRTHRHVIWSRTDLNSMRAWPDNFDAKICHAAAREISVRLGLVRTPSPFDKLQGPRPERAPKSYEMFRGLKSGVDPRRMKAEVTEIFNDSAGPAAFVAGLLQRGYSLVRGDRRDFCLIDPAGDVHSLARRLSGVNAKQLREFMTDFDREGLPTISGMKVRTTMRRAATLGARAGKCETSPTAPKPLTPKSSIAAPSASTYYPSAGQHNGRAPTAAAGSLPSGNGQHNSTVRKATAHQDWVVASKLACKSPDHLRRVMCRSFRRQSERIGPVLPSPFTLRAPTIPHLHMPVKRRLHTQPNSHNKQLPRTIFRRSDPEGRPDPRPLVQHPQERTGPMSQAELYEHYKRCGLLEVYYTWFPSG